MTFIKRDESYVGKTVRLTAEKHSISGKFVIGSVVKITDVGDRGYTFEDKDGNCISEAGFNGFEEI